MSSHLKIISFQQAFFQEECQSLDKKRHVLRLLQQRKITDVSSLKELPLPDQIPMQLVIGTKVGAPLQILHPSADITLMGMRYCC